RVEAIALGLERHIEAIALSLERRIQAVALGLQRGVELLRLVLEACSRAIGAVRGGRDRVQALGLSLERNAELLRVVPEARGRGVRRVGRDRQCLDAGSDRSQTIALRGKRRAALSSLILQSTQTANGRVVCCVG